MNHKQYSEFNSISLAKFLTNKNIWFRLHEYEEDVKTVNEANKKVQLDKIVKSLVLMDFDQKPFVVILKANKKADFKKIKKVINVKDVRLATAEEVLKYSGYKVGAVPPCCWRSIERCILDVSVTKTYKVFGGGGEVNKLIEMKTEDIIKINNPIIADISQSKDM